MNYVTLLVFIFFAYGNLRECNLAWSQDVSVEYSKEELVAALASELSSIDSFSCDYTVIYEGLNQSRTCHYGRSGTKWSYSEFSNDTDGRPRRQTQCCDDELTYSLYVTSESDGSEKWGSVRLNDRKPLTILLSPEELIGQYISSVNCSILDVLQEDSTGLELTEEGLADNRVGFRLSSHDVQNRGGILRYNVSVLLDPDFGFLPRQLLVLQSENTMPQTAWEHRWEVLKFRHVIDGRTKEKRWFPVEAVFHQGDTEAPTIRVTVKNLTVNTGLPETMFRPEIPDRVTVLDMTEEGKGRVAFTGGPRVVDMRMGLLAKEALASVDTRRSSWLIAINVAFVAFLTVVVLWRRHVAKST